MPWISEVSGRPALWFASAEVSVTSTVSLTVSVSAASSAKAFIGSDSRMAALIISENVFIIAFFMFISLMRLLYENLNHVTGFASGKYLKQYIRFLLEHDMGILIYFLKRRDVFRKV